MAVVSIAKMLPAQCRWIEWSEDHATLDWSYGCVGSVRRTGDRVVTRVLWADHEHYCDAGSMAQGRRYVERWISARRGFPGGVRRPPVPRNGFPELLPPREIGPLSRVKRQS